MNRHPALTARSVSVVASAREPSPFLRLKAHSLIPRPLRGMHLAENSIYINIARTLWAFNISKAKDAAGNDVPVDIFDFTDGACLRFRYATPSLTWRLPYDRLQLDAQAVQVQHQGPQSRSRRCHRARIRRSGGGVQAVRGVDGVCSDGIEIDRSATSLRESESSRFAFASLALPLNSPRCPVCACICGEVVLRGRRRERLGGGRRRGRTAAAGRRGSSAKYLHECGERRCDIGEARDGRTEVERRREEAESGGKEERETRSHPHRNLYCTFPQARPDRSSAPHHSPRGGFPPGWPPYAPPGEYIAPC